MDNLTQCEIEILLALVEMAKTDKMYGHNNISYERPVFLMCDLCTLSNKLNDGIFNQLTDETVEVFNEILTNK